MPERDRTFAIVYSADDHSSRIGRALAGLAATRAGFKRTDRPALDSIQRDFSQDTLVQPDRVANRVRISRLLGVDELILLTPAGDTDDAHLLVVVADGHTGVRLHTGALDTTGKSPFEIAQDINDAALDVRRVCPQGPAIVVGLAAIQTMACLQTPFCLGDTQVCCRAGPELARGSSPRGGNVGHDQGRALRNGDLKTRCSDVPLGEEYLVPDYTRLLRESLRLLPDMAVVPAAEASALTVALANEAGADRLPPVVLTCDVSVDVGASDPSTVAISVELSHPDAPRQSVQRGPLSPLEAAVFLGAELPELILRAAGRSEESVAVDLQFQRLVQQAERHAGLGSFGPAVSARETALLLRPDSVEQRIQLIRDLTEIIGTSVPKVAPYTPVDYSDRAHLRVIKNSADAYTTRLEHVRSLILNRSVPIDHATELATRAVTQRANVPFISGEVDGVYRRLGQDELRPAEDAKERFILEIMPKLLVWLTDEGRAVSATNWEYAIIEGALVRWDRTYRTKEELDFIRRVLTEVLPESRSINRKMQDFLTYQGRRYDHAMPGVPAATEADWLDFLSALEQSPHGLARRCGQHGRSVFKPGGPPRQHTPIHAPVVSDDKSQPNRRVFSSSGLGAWTVPQVREGSRTRFDELDLRIRGLDEKVVSARSIRYLMGRGWYGPGRVEACGPDLDAWLYPGAILFMREPGMLDEVFVDKNVGFADVGWDGNLVWIATRHAGVWAVRRDGQIVARFTEDDGLPPADQGIVLLPLSEGRVIASGSFGIHRRGWCALLQVNDSEHTSLTVFHQANTVGRLVRPGEKKEEGPTICFRPAWLHRYEAKDGRTKILVGRDTKYDAGTRRPLEIDAETLAVGVFGRELLGSAAAGKKYDHFSRGGFLLEWVGSQLVLYPPPGEQFDDGTEIKRLGACIVPKNNPLLVHDGWVYSIGGTWHRINPATWEAEPLDEASLKPWRMDAAAYCLAVSAHYGVIAWESSVFCRISFDPPKGR